MALNFEKHAPEGNEFINDLASRLNHPEDKGQVGILVRAVLHTLRDRITIAKSFHLLQQLPMFLKGLYVEQWKYREKPVKMETFKDFCDNVKIEQSKLGEQRFNWKTSTESLVKVVIEAIALRYISTGEISDIVDELPAELKQIFAGQEV